jgi:hypothetical protein
MKRQRPEEHPSRERIADLLAGTLSGREEEELTAHLEDCTLCRGLADRLEALWQNLPDRVPAAAPFDLWPAVRARLHAPTVLSFPVSQPWWRLAVSFAAGLLIGIAAWQFATGSQGPAAAMAEELAVHETLVAGLDPIPPQSMGGLWLQTVEQQVITPEDKQ